MPAHRSDDELLVLHAVRLRGMATAAAAAARFGVDRGTAAELLLDFEARGWVRHDEFAGAAGWSLTAAGRAEDERRLHDELERTAAKPAVRSAHAAFLPLNAQLQSAVTRWQLRPLPGDDLAANDHTDVRWDDRVVGDLTALGRRLGVLLPPLADVLARFDGYDERFQQAAGAVRRGDRRRVDGLEVDSCHRIWFELHEDLLATLGLDRASEATGG